MKTANLFQNIRYLIFLKFYFEKLIMTSIMYQINFSFTQKNHDYEKTSKKKTCRLKG